MLLKKASPTITCVKQLFYRVWSLFLNVGRLFFQKNDTFIFVRSMFLNKKDHLFSVKQVVLLSPLLLRHHQVGSAFVQLMVHVTHVAEPSAKLHVCILADDEGWVAGGEALHDVLYQHGLRV